MAQLTTDTEQDTRTASDPPQDPKVHPAPPSNPEIDEEALERSEETLEEVAGH